MMTPGGAAVDRGNRQPLIPGIGRASNSTKASVATLESGRYRTDAARAEWWLLSLKSYDVKIVQGGCPMYESYEMKELSDAFTDGVKILKGIVGCFAQFTERFEVKVSADLVDERKGEVVFWIAGQKMYAGVHTARYQQEDGTRNTAKQILWGNFSGEEKEEPLVTTPYGEESNVSITADAAEGRRKLNGAFLHIVLPLRQGGGLLIPAKQAAVGCQWLPRPQWTDIPPP